MKQAQKICPRIPHLKRKMLSFENGSKNVRGFQWIGNNVCGILWFTEAGERKKNIIVWNVL